MRVREGGKREEGRKGKKAKRRCMCAKERNNNKQGHSEVGAGPSFSLFFKRAGGITCLSDVCVVLRVKGRERMER
jgi:hypothetical protein